MAKKQGFKDDGIDSYVYQETAAGSSFAIGIDSSSANDDLVIRASSTPGANPSTTGQLVIGNGANSNITFTPNGSGTLVMIKPAAVTTQMLIINNSAAAGGVAVTATLTLPGGDDSYSAYGLFLSTLWAVGFDNSDADSFKITNGVGATPSTGNLVMHSRLSGETNFPLQSAFSARLNADDANVTGNGTAYTLGTNVAWTESYDQNNDFNTNGTFTAPVAGRYHFSAAVRLTGFAAATGSILRLSVNGGTTLYHLDESNPQPTAGGFWIAKGSAYVDLAAADTVVLQIIVSGEAADTVDIDGDVNFFTHFGGKLVA